MERRAAIVVLVFVLSGIGTIAWGEGPNTELEDLVRLWAQNDVLRATVRQLVQENRELKRKIQRLEELLEDRHRLLGERAQQSGAAPFQNAVADPGGSPLADVPFHYYAIDAVLEEIPGELMPSGTMSAVEKDAFCQWAAHNLGGKMIFADLAFERVESSSPAHATLVGQAAFPVLVNGRRVRCEVRAYLEGSSAAVEFAGCQEGDILAIQGVLAETDPLAPDWGEVEGADGTARVFGWNEKEAFFIMKLETCPAERVVLKRAAVDPKGFFHLGAGKGDKIVFLLDRSGSMTDSLDYVKFELRRAIGELGEDKFFHVIFYSSGHPAELPGRSLVPATEGTKEVAFRFIDDIIAEGETEPSLAIERAFALQPDVIYLLTDGEFDRKIVGLARHLNTDGKVTVHTIGFLYRLGESMLRQIARENGGTYRFVSDADLAALCK